jgi:hypothetical protein
MLGKPTTRLGTCLVASVFVCFLCLLACCCGGGGYQLSMLGWSCYGKDEKIFFLFLFKKKTKFRENYV